MSARIPSAWLGQETADQVRDLPWFHVASSLELGVDQLAIHGHFETATFRGDQPDGLNIPFEFFGQFGHQTDGPLGVVSDYAVLDADVHDVPRGPILVIDSTMRIRS